MRRMPKRTRAGIDRLARGAHAFHRFAHHPLCGEYAGETVRIGRRARICRGCAMVALGGAAGIAIGLARPLPPAIATALVVTGFILAAKRLRSKIASRFLPAVFAGAALVSGIVPALVAAAAISLAVVRYRRRGPDRSPCAACPEREGPSPCRGYAAIVRRERAFRRFAARRFDFARLERAGNPP